MDAVLIERIPHCNYVGILVLTNHFPCIFVYRLEDKLQTIVYTVLQYASNTSPIYLSWSVYLHMKKISTIHKKIGTAKLNIELNDFPISAVISDVIPVWIHTTIIERINFIISTLDFASFQRHFSFTCTISPFKEYQYTDHIILITL